LLQARSHLAVVRLFVKYCDF